MKRSFFLLGLALAAAVLLSTGCKTVPTTTTVTGQIQVRDGDVIQKTGLAPIWIYDATNSFPTNALPVPNFGGRTRQDWKRIVTAYPNSLNVYSNYAVLQPLGPATEIKRIAANAELYRLKSELRGATNGPAWEAVQRQETEFLRLMKLENSYWDAADDTRDLIVLWYNLNPGILYATGLPQPQWTAQTDQNGTFQFTVPVGKPVFIATHIEGNINGKPGNYFWLVPFIANAQSSNTIVLDRANATRLRPRAKMPQIILPEENGYIGAVGFWMLNRVRDARASFEPATPTGAIPLSGSETK